MNKTLAVDYKLWKVVFLLLLSMLMISCSDVECIDPDDFGGVPKVTIDSKGKNPTPIPGTNFQAVDWEQKYALTGDPVVMVIQNTVSQLVPKDKDQTINCKLAFDELNSWSPLFSNLPSVKINNPASWLKEQTTPCDTGANPWCACLSMEKDVPAANLPSRFYMGIGLYLSLGASGKAPIKQNLECGLQGNPSNCLIHVGDSACPDPVNSRCNTGFMSQYCPAGGMKFDPPSVCSDGSCMLYMKILDRFYNDNSGQYTAVFKKGVKTVEPGAIASFASLVMEKLCNSSQAIYNKIVHESSFIGYVRVLLTLYIAFTAIGFLVGTIQLSHVELVIRIFKIALVMQVVASDASWSFFSKTFFYFFQNGVSELISILFGQGAGGTTPQAITAAGVTSSDASCIPNVAGFQAFDDVLSIIFSHATIVKIVSIIPWMLFGFVYVGIIAFGIGLILYTLVNALLVFLVSYLAISLLIILAPIFIPFILFKITRDFFETWLKQFVSFFIQPLIILAFAFFLITMLINQLYFLFGYRVCFKEWQPLGFGMKIFLWQPDFNDAKECMLTPNTIFDITDQGDMVPVKFPGPSCGSIPGKQTSTGNCDPYVCSQERYVGFPYLNPLLESDQRRIDELKSNNIISLSDIVMFILIIWFMMKFNKLVPSIAKSLAGAEMSGTDIHGAAAGLKKWVDSAAKTGARGAYIAAGVGARGTYIVGKTVARGLISGVVGVGKRADYLAGGRFSRAAGGVAGTIKGVGRAADAFTGGRLSTVAGKVGTVAGKVGTVAGKVGSALKGPISSPRETFKSVKEGYQDIVGRRIENATPGKIGMLPVKGFLKLFGAGVSATKYLGGKAIGAFKGKPPTGPSQGGGQGQPPAARTQVTGTPPPPPPPPPPPVGGTTAPAQPAGGGAPTAAPAAPPTSGQPATTSTGAAQPRTKKRKGSPPSGKGSQ